MHAFRSVLALLVLCGTVYGQISIGQKHEPFRPIVAKLDTPIPDGATVNGGFTSTADWLDAGDRTIHIWAKPGQHTVNFRGFWLQTKTITVDGQELKVLVDAGWVDETAAFEVLEGDDSPDPPPPPPPGKRWGIILRESSEQNPDIAKLMIGLRFKLGPDKLKIEDIDNLGPAWAPYVQAYRESQHPLPVLVVVGEDDNRVAKVLPLPATVAEILQEIGE